MQKLQCIYLSDEADMDLFNSWGMDDEEDDDWDDSEFEDD